MVDNTYEQLVILTQQNHVHILWDKLSINIIHLGQQFT